MVESEQSLPVLEPPAPDWQNPSTQSSSSSQSSSWLHALARSQTPASQLPPGPHSPSEAHAVHLPALHTWPPSQSASLVHSGVSSFFTTHAFSTQDSPSLQSSSESQVGFFGFFLGQA